MNAYMYPNIEAERVRKGLSQEELIRELGYKERKTYYNWLSSGNIPESVLLKMADLFDCSIDYLLRRGNLPADRVTAEESIRNDPETRKE